MSDRVSILLPTHARRAGGYLERSIESVLAQTHGDFELIVIDDGSTDGTADLIAWYARQDSRVSTLRFEQNVGLPALTTGAGYLQTTGDFVVATFDDCVLLPHHLERLLAALRADPAALMAYGQIETHWMAGGSVVIGAPYDAHHMRIANNHIPNACVMLRRQAVERFGWYDPHVLMKRFCDWDLWLRIGSTRAPTFVAEVLAHEFGTGLPDSLGERVTVFRDLMLRYSRTLRDDLLMPGELEKYDPFRLDVGLALSEQDIQDLEFLVLEHLLTIGDEDFLLRRFPYSAPDPSAAVNGLRAKYLDRRLAMVGKERNSMQHELLSLRPGHEQQMAQLCSELAVASSGAGAEAEIRALEVKLAERLQGEQALVERLAEAERQWIEERAQHEAQAAVGGQALAEQLAEREQAEQTFLAGFAELEARLAQAEDRGNAAEVSLADVQSRLEAERSAALAAKEAASESVARLKEELLAVRSELSRVRQEEHGQRAHLEDLKQELAANQAELQRVLRGALMESQSRREELERFSAEREAWYERRRAWSASESRFESARLDWAQQRATAEHRFHQELGRLRGVEDENVDLKHRLDGLQVYSRKVTNIVNRLLVSRYWRASYPIRAIKARLRGKSPVIQIPALPEPAGQEGSASVLPLPALFDGPVADGSQWIVSGGQVNSGQESTTNGLAAKHNRIIAIGDGPIPSVELCLSLPLEYMRAELGVEYELFYQSELPAREVWSSADLIVMMRICNPESVALATEARALGIPIIYMTDDDIGEIDPSTPLGMHYANMNASRNIHDLVSLSDKVMVFSQALMEKFAASTNDVFIANAVSGIEHFDRQLKVNRPPHQRKEIRIGYSGSPTHLRDVSLIGEVLMDILAKYPDVVVEAVWQEIPTLRGNPRYRHFGQIGNLSQFAEFQHSRDWDIALGPLEDTVFNRAKSDNKYRTYGAAGIAGVYSKVAPFERSVQNGRTGFLVENSPGQWREALEKLINDSEFRRQMGQAARGDVRARFSLPTIAQEYHRTYLGAISGLRVLAVGPLHLPTAHIDVLIPFEQLRRKGLIHPRMKDVVNATHEDLAWADVLVVVRAVDPEVSDLIREAHRRGVKTIFTWDDDFFSLTSEHQDLKNYYDNPAIRSSMESILSGVDLVKASTTRIEEVSRRYNDNVLTAPYGFDMNLLPAAIEPRQDGRIRIGYFGTVGRGAEFQCVLTALERVVDEHPEVDVEFFGFSPPGSESIKRVRSLPFENDYAGSIRQLAERQWDIALAPLGLGAMAKAKLPTKYRDYGAVGAAAVYTDVESYRGVVREGETGLMTDNSTEGWYVAIKRLVVDHSLRRAIAEAAHRDVRDNYGLDRVIDAWTDAFRRLGFAVPRQ